MKDHHESERELFRRITNNMCFPESREAEASVLVFVFSPFLCHEGFFSFTRISVFMYHYHYFRYVGT